PPPTYTLSLHDALPISRAGAEPTDVLGRVSDVSELPVEQRPEAVPADDEVADPEIAVHDHLAGIVGGVGAEPAQRELEHRPADRSEEHTSELQSREKLV